MSNMRNGRLHSANGKGVDSLEKVGAPENLPRHVAIIMDGNGRWAKARFLPRVAGHRAGAKTVREIVEESRALGVRYLTLFSFSSENWNRPAAEVQALMELFMHHLESELPTLVGNGVRLRAIGDLARLPEGVRERLDRAMEQSKHVDGLDLILAISYGARDEIVHAARSLAESVLAGQLAPADIGVEDFQRRLYAPDVPDPDVLIRTSDEYRISNFLLWQLAYTEIVVSPLLWPEFSREEYRRCLQEYAGRVRRFGLTDEQCEAGASS